MQEGTHSDSHQLAEFGYRQELHRTLGSFSSFAAGYSYISIMTGMFQTAALGLKSQVIHSPPRRVTIAS